MELTCEETEKIYQEYWRLNNIHVIYSIYQEIKEEISNFIEVYHKFKGENRIPDQISKLIEILQEVSDLEDYKKMLEEIIENYEKKYSHIQVSCHQLEFDY